MFRTTFPSDLISRFPYIKNDDEKWDKAWGFPFLQISFYFVCSVFIWKQILRQKILEKSTHLLHSMCTDKIFMSEIITLSFIFVQITNSFGVILRLYIVKKVVRRNWIHYSFLSVIYSLWSFFGITRYIADEFIVY